MSNLEDEVRDLLFLDPEKDDGNIEYKRQLSDLSQETLEHKSTQMQYRLSQGNGECFYVIGIEDDGTAYGNTDEERDMTLEILQKIADMNDYTLRIVDTRRLNGRTIQRILIRENNLVRYRELRIGVAGNVDAGKSTLVGCLCTGELDNGRGKSREYSFNYRHELETGRTSSVSQNIVCYDVDGKHISQTNGMKRLTWDEMTKQSAKVVTLFDLCGHAKYSGTTFTGMSSNHIDYVFILVGSKIKSTDSTIEHIRMAMAYQIPIVFVITKMDTLHDKPEAFKDIMNSLHSLFSKNATRKLYKIKSISDVMTAIELTHTVPVFKISSVSGEGLDLLHSFLNLCPPRHSFDANGPIQLEVWETYFVKGVGTVVGGFLSKGTIAMDQEYYLGPDKHANFKTVKVRSIHVKRRITMEATAGKYVCVNIPKLKREEIKRGMVMLTIPVKAVTRFDAEIIVPESHHTTIRIGYTPILILRGYRSAVRLTAIHAKNEINLRKSKEIVPRGNLTMVAFETMYRPVFLQEGERIILVEGGLRIIGKVTCIR